ncbi:MAG TPA: NADH-quinone oxidoreductase subunit H [Candidatus Lokiarchaeia archaeon]|nr:NADH-quinone oxidoreductase subunit H [Candidatus Lokiarchaeia archaeon]
MAVDLTVILFQIGFTAILTLGLFLFGGLTLGIFQKLRGTTLKVYKPFLEVFKLSFKEPSKQATTSASARALVLAAWIISSFAVILWVPLGSLPELPPEVNWLLLPNIFGNFQLFAMFGFLMIYPVGLMILCFLSQRKASILNLKSLSEDFFSAFITFVLSSFSLLLIYFGGFNFAQFPSMNELIAFQAAIPGIPMTVLSFSKYLGLLNPLALVAFFAIMPVVYHPLEFGSGFISKKWTPISDYSAKSLAWIKVVDMLRLVALAALFIDLFLGGAQFTSIWYIDVPLFFAILLVVVVLLSFVKQRTEKWILDKQLSGFIHVHTIIALAALVLSIVLVYA